MNLNKKQCDRCGVEYQQENKNLMELRFTQELKAGSFYLFPNHTGQQELDLCENCYKDFKNWWNKN